MIMEESVAQHCSGCGLRIVDRFYLLAVDRQWHNECLKCTICGLGLGNHLTCFARDGEIYCRDDYTRRYSVSGSHRSNSNNSEFPHNINHSNQGRCGRCGNSIGSQELVMRAKELVFHLQCFVCVICLRVLNKGDHFGMRSSALYCAEHYELIEPRPPSPQPNFFNGAGSGQKGRPRKRNKDLQDVVTTPCGDLLGTPNSDSVSGVLRLVEGGGYESSSSSCPGGPAGQRTKRMRTSFKHHQLRTMKSYFGINQNPDAKDLKQLAQKTGLSKRVLQVWFQNARAKWRRNTIRSDSGGKSGGTTPTRDSDLGQSTSSQDLLLQQTQLQNSLVGGIHGGLSDTEGGFSNDIY